MRAVAYYRVSTQRQAGEDRFSLPVQKEMFLKRCSERGYVPVAEYTDSESGRSASRKGYQQLLTDARAGKFDVIVVRAIDRFGRDADEITVRTAELRQAGVQVDAITSIVDADLPGDTQFLLRAVEAYLAQKESANTASRVRSSMVKASMEGLWLGRPPYGYKVEDKHLVIHEPEAEVVRWIYREFADRNIGARRLALQLNERHVPTQRGVAWAQQTVMAILTRETYTGTFEWADSGTAVEVPAIIDRDLWDRACSRWRTRKRSGTGQTHTGSNLLTGLLYCGACGARMVCIRDKRTRKRDGETVFYRWYVCNGYQTGFSECRNKTNADAVEEKVIRDLLTIEPAVVLIEPKYSPVTELAKAKTELAAITTRRQRTLDNLSRGLISDTEYLETMALIEHDAERYQSHVERLEQDVADADAARAELLLRPERLQTLIDPTLSPQEKKAILQTYVTRIELNPGDSEPYIVA